MGKQKNKYEKQREALKNRYNARHVFRWLGYADEDKEKPLVDIITKIAKRLNVKPSFLYTYAIGEGLGKKHLSKATNYDSTTGILRTDAPTSGLNHFGVDDFGDDYSRAMVKKHLPKDYNEGDEFFVAKGHRPNDFGRKEVNTAFFKDLESGFEGFAAILLHRRDLFITHARQLGYPNPNEDQIAFWTYCYFQGEGRAKRYLIYNKGLDYNKPPISDMKEVKELALERLATWRYIEMNNLFEETL